MQSLAAMSVNCEFRLFVALVQLDPDPEMVGEVCDPPKQTSPHFGVGLGIRSACGNDAPAKTAARAGSGVAVAIWAEALDARANPRSTTAKTLLTPRLFF